MQFQTVTSCGRQLQRCRWRPIGIRPVAGRKKAAGVIRRPGVCRIKTAIYFFRRTTANKPNKLMPAMASVEGSGAGVIVRLDNTAGLVMVPRISE